MTNYPNSVGNNFATVAGGYGNTANGLGSTAMGAYNTASGFGSFAAGLSAQALHDRSFVWSDGFNVPFASTAAFQFSVQAANGIVLAGDVQMEGGAYTYHHLALNGGNSEGFLYGSYNYFSDGVHLGYNFYADSAGNPHVINAGGGSSRVTATYGEVVLAVGNVNFGPNIVRVDATLSGVTVYGTFNNMSDRNAKQDFAPVNASQILDKVLQLPVSEWSYKEDSKTRHIGPVAQDFYSTFNLGADDKHIAPIDEGDIAFAAIQGLNNKVEDEKQILHEELESKEARITALETELAKLKQMVDKLAHQKD